MVLILSVINKICELLNEQNKKQKDLTDYLGVSKNRFTDWKSGRINSYLDYLPQIADFFNVSIDYLFGREIKQKNKVVAYSGDNPLKKDIENQINFIFDNIDNELQLSQIKMYLETYKK